MVAWLAVFGSKGVTNTVVGSWALDCCHQLSSRSVLNPYKDASARFSQKHVRYFRENPGTLVRLLMLCIVVAA
eukprot:33155-Pleurochrysis_carterae.AAC.1